MVRVALAADPTRRNRDESGSSAHNPGHRRLGKPDEPLGSHRQDLLRVAELPSQHQQSAHGLYQRLRRGRQHDGLWHSIVCL
jgi:hypothetical protein